MLALTLIDWIFDKSDFWAPNIQSAKTLRKQIAKLENQMKRDRGKEPYIPPEE